MNYCYYRELHMHPYKLVENFIEKFFCNQAAPKNFERK